MAGAAIAIIPARGGPKRIPGKNIKPFADKPIIAYSIDAARESGLFERVIVSTDSQEIAEFARQYNAEVPFVREQALADDLTPVSSATGGARRPRGSRIIRRPTTIRSPATVADGSRAA